MTVKKKKVVEEVKALTEVEMLKLDLANKEMRIIELEIIAMTNKKKVMDLEFNSEIEKKRTTHKAFSDAKDRLTQGFVNKYKLEKGLKAYDPLTGEIHE